MKYKKHDLTKGENGFKYYCKNCKISFHTKPPFVCQIKIENKRLMGKHSRAAGKRFELKVRADLESRGWIVFKNSNDVKFEDFTTPDNKYGGVGRHGKFVACKPKFNPFTKSLMMNSGGFPDFILIKREIDNINLAIFPMNVVQFVECKTNAMLDKAEKEKIEWIKQSLKIPVLIASKGIKRGEIYYEIK
jgi:hypothetical protein